MHIPELENDLDQTQIPELSETTATVMSEENVRETSYNAADAIASMSETSREEAEGVSFESLSAGLLEELELDVSDLQVSRASEEIANAQTAVIESSGDVLEKADDYLVLEELNDRYQRVTLPAAIERSAARVYADEGDGNYSEDFFKDGSFRAAMEDEMAFNMYATKKMGELQQAVTESGVGGGVYDALSTFNIPAQLAYSVFSSGGISIRDTADILFDNNTPLAERIAKLDEVVAEIKSVGIDSFPQNDFRVLAMTEQFLSGTTGEHQAFTDMMFASVDAGITLGSMGLMNKMGNGIKRITAGARKEAAEESITKLANPDALPTTTVDESVESVMPSALSQRTFLPNTVNVSSEVEEALEGAAVVARRIQDVHTSARIKQSDVTDEAVMAALDDIKSIVVHDFGKRRVKDVRIADIPTASLLDDTAKAEIIIGKSKGGAYSTQARAQKALNDMDATDGSVVQGSDGGYWIKLKRDVDEAGMLRGLPVNPHKTVDWSMEDTVVGRALLGARLHVSDEILSNGQIAVSAKDELSLIGKEIFKPINALNKKERKRLGDVMSTGSQRGVWFDELELKAMDLSDKEILGYYGLVQANNVAYEVLNSVMRKELRSKNMRQITFKDVNGAETLGIGRVIDDVPLGETIYDASAGRIYIRGDLNETQLKNLMEVKGLKAVQMADNTMIQASQEGLRVPVRTYLVRDGLKQEDLAGRVLNYKEGGNRFYTAKKFIKQDNIHSGPRGEKYVLNAITHAASDNVVELRKRVESINDLTDSYKAYRADGSEANLIRLEAAASDNGYTSIAKYEEALLEGKASLGKADIYNDGERPLAHRNTAEGIDLSSGMSDTYTNFEQTGRTAYRKKGDVLSDPRDGMASTVDPAAAISKGMNNAFNTGVMYNYQTRQINRWIEGNKNMMDASKIRGKSQWEIFNGAGSEFNTGSIWIREATGSLKPQLNQALAQRNVIQRTISTDTFLSKGFRKTRDALVEHIPFAGDEFKAKAADALSVDPLSAMKGLAFDLKLGMFNFVQAPLQITTAMTASLIDPVNGVKAAMLHTNLRWALKNDNPAVLLEIAKRSKGLHGLEPEEVVKMAQGFKNSGFGRIGQGITELSDVESNFLNMERVSKVKEAGRFFFTEAEKVNRTHGWAMAWLRMKAKHPKLDLTSQAGREVVMLEANKLNFNMTRASNSALGQGVPSIPTQFLSYPMRFSEAILSPKAGWSKKERGALVASQIFLFGLENMPGESSIVEYINETYPDGKPPFLAKVLKDGIYNSVIFWGTSGETDLDFGRYSVLEGFPDQVMSYFNGEKSTVESLTGASGSIAYDIVKSGQGRLNWDTVEKVARNISSVEQVLMVRDWMNSKGEQIINRGGAILDTGVSSKTMALRTILGVKTSGESERSSYLTARYKSGKLAKELGREYGRLRTLAMRADTNEDIRKFNDLALDFLYMSTDGEDVSFRADVEREGNKVFSRNLQTIDGSIQRTNLINSLKDIHNGGAN